MTEPNEKDIADKISASQAGQVQAIVPYCDYDEAGVDLSLLRWFLGLTPLQRLQVMEKNARDTLILSEYGRRHREAKSAANR